MKLIDNSKKGVRNMFRNFLQIETNNTNIFNLYKNKTEQIQLYGTRINNIFNMYSNQKIDDTSIILIENKKYKILHRQYFQSQLRLQHL